MATSQLVFDPICADEAILRLDATLQGVDLSNQQKYRPNLDLGRVGIVLLAVARYASMPEIRASFELLPKDFFDIRHLDMLTDLGWAAWSTNVRYNELLATKSKRVVPPDLAERATARKKRMLRVLAYHLYDDPLVALRLQSVGKRPGYLNAASDLTVLADLYKTHKKQLVSDTKWFRDADINEAEEDAAQLMRCLGVGLEDSTKEAVELLTRIFIVIRDTYDKVRTAASFVFAKNTEHLRHFPVLHTAVRCRAKPAKKSLPEPLVVPEEQSLEGETVLPQSDTQANPPANHAAPSLVDDTPAVPILRQEPLESVVSPGPMGATRAKPRRHTKSVRPKARASPR